MTGRVVCFGELLLRLSAPTGQRLLQSAAFEVCVGGAEANVAVCLAQLGQRADLVSIAPDNALGRAARDEVRRHGVNTDRVHLVDDGRMGLYFLTPGAMQRAADVLYDRRDSAFARARADTIDWAPVLDGADWLHLSGVTPAVGASAAEAALRAAEAATAHGVQLSFDGNYRSKLWAEWKGDGPAILRRLFGHATLVFAEERDFELILGESFVGDDTLSRRRNAARAAFAAFPRLQRIVSTIRTVHAPHDHSLQGVAFTRNDEHLTETFRLSLIVDRIGGGDAFAAGFLCGVQEGRGVGEALALAMASTCLKHGVAGDFNRVTRQELDGVLAGGGGDVKR
jgi:2-dehydro-3-deoxygluconokinase